MRVSKRTIESDHDPQYVGERRGIIVIRYFHAFHNAFVIGRQPQDFQNDMSASKPGLKMRINRKMIATPNATCQMFSLSNVEGKNENRDRRMDLSYGKLLREASGIHFPFVILAELFEPGVEE